MANRWGGGVETVTDFIFLGSKITVNLDCSHEILKRHMLPGRITVTNLDSVLKSRDTTLLTKICLVKAMVLPVVTYNMRIGPLRRLSTEEVMLLNCGAGDDS